MHKITKRKAWTDNESLAVIELYNYFLNCQLNDEAYTKASKVRHLAELLGRSKGSIEAKLMNVSAVMRDLGNVWVTGYKPLSNYNKSLKDQVINFLDGEEGAINE